MVWQPAKATAKTDAKSTCLSIGPPRYFVRLKYVIRKLDMYNTTNKEMSPGFSYTPAPRDRDKLVNGLSRQSPIAFVR